ncbi:hypothetical protein FOTG_13486 [Fusarium oxysporum f. sp. vasinfectum 25433]|uniref:Uncharacterized protein n=1 Tax=Fusarium oxysporum f. sp. vasinfectum 25433 TaxID=1089449 RepID=X0KXM8_FUSOX|nr:hypothetical protein FOTG_13486 [Fusarium oxysporum f. sp. vasinfectum 25433]
MSIFAIDRRTLMLPPLVQGQLIRDPVMRLRGQKRLQPQRTKALQARHLDLQFLAARVTPGFGLRVLHPRERETHTITEGKPATKWAETIERAQTTKQPPTSNTEETASIYDKLTDDVKLVSGTIDLLVCPIVR